MKLSPGTGRLGFTAGLPLPPNTPNLKLVTGAPSTCGESDSRPRADGPSGAPTAPTLGGHPTACSARSIRGQPTRPLAGGQAGACCSTAPSPPARIPGAQPAGTLRPAAEDGVGEPGAALGAPHKLHQLLSQFGHVGGLASGAALPQHLPWHMGKGRLQRPELRDGGRRHRRSAGAEREAASRHLLGTRLSSPVRAEKEFPRGGSTLTSGSYGARRHLPGSGSGVAIKEERWPGSGDHGFI